MATEKRLIDVNAFRDYWNKNYRHQYANENFLIALANFPTVDAVPVVHGRWTYTEGEYEVYMICSECGWDSDFRTNYCPNCGAKMDGDENG